MKHLKPIFLLLLVFMAGLGVGIVSTRAVVRHFIRQAVHNPDFVRLRIERDLTRKLKLDAPQQMKVRQILIQGQSDIQQLRSEYQPRFAVIIDRANTGISAVLTPEQQGKFAQIQARNQALWKPPAKGRN
jgi:hypothetical protein